MLGYCIKGRNIYIYMGVDKGEFIHMRAHSYDTGFYTLAMVPEVSSDILPRFLGSLENSRIDTADYGRKNKRA